MKEPCYYGDIYRPFHHFTMDFYDFCIYPASFHCEEFFTAGFEQIFHLLYLFLQKSMFNKNYYEEVFSRDDRDNGSCPDGMW